MPRLQIYVDDDTLARLHSVARERGCNAQALAEAAVAAAAILAAPGVTAPPRCRHCAGTGCADYAGFAMERCEPCGGSGKATPAAAALDA